MARLIGGIARSAGFHPLDRAAVARLIEHAARLADDQSKLTLMAERVRDVMAEANYHARSAGRALIAREDVEAAIRQQDRRSARIEDRSRR